MQTSTKRHHLAILFLLLLLAQSSIVRHAAAQSPSPDVPFATVPIPSDAQFSELLPSAPASRATKPPKLDTSIARLAAVAEISAEQAIAVAQSQSQRVTGNHVNVEMVIDPAHLADVQQAMVDTGGEITIVAGSALVQGWLPVNMIQALARARMSTIYASRPEPCHSTTVSRRKACPP